MSDLPNVGFPNTSLANLPEITGGSVGRAASPPAAAQVGGKVGEGATSSVTTPTAPADNNETTPPSNSNFEPVPPSGVFTPPPQTQDVKPGEGQGQPMPTTPADNPQPLPTTPPPAQPL